MQWVLDDLWPVPLSMCTRSARLQDQEKFFNSKYVKEWIKAYRKERGEETEEPAIAGLLEQDEIPFDTDTPSKDALLVTYEDGLKGWETAIDDEFGDLHCIPAGEEMPTQYQQDIDGDDCALCGQMVTTKDVFEDGYVQSVGAIAHKSCYDNNYGRY